jgi:hypothetical protein
MNSRHMTLTTAIFCPFAVFEQIGAPARRAGREIDRPQQALVLGDVGNDVALVPDVIAGGDAIHSGVVQLGADLGRDTEACRRVLAVDHDEIEAELAAQARHVARHRLAAGTSDDIAAEQDPHALNKGASALVGQHQSSRSSSGPCGTVSLRS